MSRHTPDFRFMCRHESVNDTCFFFFFVENICNFWRCLYSPPLARWRINYTWIFDPFLFPFFFPHFACANRTAERERERAGNIDFGFVVPRIHRLLSLGSVVILPLSLSFGNGRNDIKIRGSSSARPRLVCWKLVRSRLRTCIGACPWPGTKANTGVRHEAELNAFDMSWFITTRSVWRT